METFLWAFPAWANQSSQSLLPSVHCCGTGFTLPFRQRGVLRWIRQALKWIYSLEGKKDVDILKGNDARKLRMGGRGMSKEVRSGYICSFTSFKVWSSKSAMWSCCQCCQPWIPLCGSSVQFSSVGNFTMVQLEGLPPLHGVDYFNMCISVRTWSGEQDYDGLWDNESIIGKGPYIIWGRDGEEKAWKGKLKNQGKVTNQPWLSEKCGSQANPATGIEGRGPG